ncbi:hypothetical protein FB645_003890 [Coemansia sp. IMI 203386]|nr:hypothetical protein FB645_003890 [Coemansia sp. IMI 203386]
MEEDSMFLSGSGSSQQPVRLMLSCDNCRRKKIRCNGDKPECSNCAKSKAACHYSPVGPRKKPRKTPAPLGINEPEESVNRSGGDSKHKRRVNKRRASSLQPSDTDEVRSASAHDAGDSSSAGVTSISHLMLERLRENEGLGLPGRNVLGQTDGGQERTQQNQTPVMEMLRLQTQISSLVDQLRNITIRASGITPVSTSPLGSPTFASESAQQHQHQQQPLQQQHQQQALETTYRQNQQVHGSQSQFQSLVDAAGSAMPASACVGSQRSTNQTRSEAYGASASSRRPSSTQPDGCSQRGCESRSDDVHLKKQSDSAQSIVVSRDLINHLTSVFFQYCHPAETGMYPIELYRDRLQRAQVSEPFLLSVLAVASRFSDDPRVKREPAYLAGYDFFDRVTRRLMMDVLERDCVENMLTLNNLAVYAVGLPVANRGWYFSGLAIRMATQMSLQKVDAPGRMPGASMMSGPGIESARRAFWTTLLLEALASFASGEPPPITIQDIHVAEPYDDPSILGDEPGTTADTSEDVDMHESPAPTMASAPAYRARSSSGGRPSVCAYIAQLAMLLIRVARLNGNRHPESAQFSPEYAALHAEMVAWYHGLPDNMQIKPTVAKDEIQRDPQMFAAKMFVHCHYHAAIIALHQPRVDLVRVGSPGTMGTFHDGDAADSSDGANSGSRTGTGSNARARYGSHQQQRPPGSDQQWRHLAQQQCLTAACTMTELLTLARNLDVRYHIVTFGFAVFMAGVVHVGAVAYTPPDSTERQYSINCVKEHVRCLDRLGKYFAFHFIMAKHIRAQLQVIENADLRRRNAAAAAVASALSSSGTGSIQAVDILGIESRSHQQRLQSRHLPRTAGIPAGGNSGLPFDLAAAFSMGSQFSPGMPSSASLASSGAAQTLSAMDISDMGLDAGLFVSSGTGGSSGVIPNSGANSIGPGSPWLFSQTSGGFANTAGGASRTAPVGDQTAGTTSMDMLFGLLSSQPPQQSPGPATTNSTASCPMPGLCGGLCGMHSPTTTASMISGLQGLSGLAGLGSGISSLAQLFSSNSDGLASLYPEKIVNNSSLAPSRESNTGSCTSRASINNIVVGSEPAQSQQVSAQSSFSSIAASQADPAAPLRLTTPGGVQQFGSLPPFSPL